MAWTWSGSDLGQATFFVAVSLRETIAEGLTALVVDLPLTTRSYVETTAQRMSEFWVVVVREER